MVFEPNSGMEYNQYMSKIAQLRDALGITQNDLASLVGTTQPQIWRLENGKRKMTKEWAEKLAPALGVRPEEILFDDIFAPMHSIPLSKHHDEPEVHWPQDKPNAIIGKRLEGDPGKVPLFGRAVGGVFGEFEMNGSLLGTVMVPPKLAGVQGVYAVQVAGDSMSPRYDDGETCIIDPTYRVKKGDYVVAQIQLDENGPLLAYIKRFCRRNDVELILEQLNPPRELRFPAESVKTVHYIAVSGNV